MLTLQQVYRKVFEKDPYFSFTEDELYKLLDNLRIKVFQSYGSERYEGMDYLINDENEFHQLTVTGFQTYLKQNPHFMNLLPSTTTLSTDKKFEVRFNEKYKFVQFYYKAGMLDSKKPMLSKPYSLTEIMEFEVVDDSVVSVRNSRTGNMLVGGLLFGSLGMLAGAALPGKDKVKNINRYCVRFMIDDMDLAAIEVTCESREMVYKLVNTFAVFERRLQTTSELNVEVVN